MSSVSELWMRVDRAKSVRFDELLSVSSSLRASLEPQRLLPPSDMSEMMPLSAEQRDVSPGRDRDELEEDEALEDEEDDVEEDAPLLLPTEMTECGRRALGRSPSAGGTDGEPRRRGPLLS